MSSPDVVDCTSARARALATQLYSYFVYLGSEKLNLFGRFARRWFQDCELSCRFGLISREQIWSVACILSLSQAISALHELAANIKE